MKLMKTEILKMQMEGVTGISSCIIISDQWAIILDSIWNVVEYRLGLSYSSWSMGSFKMSENWFRMIE